MPLIRALALIVSLCFMPLGCTPLGADPVRISVYTSNPQLFPEALRRFDQN